MDRRAKKKSKKKKDEDSDYRDVGIYDDSLFEDDRDRDAKW